MPWGVLSLSYCPGDPGTGHLPFVLTRWGPVPSASHPAASGSWGILPESLHVGATRGIRRLVYLHS